jgi:hypothetical protein
MFCASAGSSPTIRHGEATTRLIPRFHAARWLVAAQVDDAVGNDDVDGVVGSGICSMWPLGHVLNALRLAVLFGRASIPSVCRGHRRSPPPLGGQEHVDAAAEPRSRTVSPRVGPAVGLLQPNDASTAAEGRSATWSMAYRSLVMTHSSSRSWWSWLASDRSAAGGERALTRREPARGRLRGRGGMALAGHRAPCLIPCGRFGQGVLPLVGWLTAGQAVQQPCSVATMKSLFRR